LTALIAEHTGLAVTITPEGRFGHKLSFAGTDLQCVVQVRELLDDHRLFGAAQSISSQINRQLKWQKFQSDVAFLFQESRQLLLELFERRYREFDFDTEKVLYDLSALDYAPIDKQLREDDFKLVNAMRQLRRMGLIEYMQSLSRPAIALSSEGHEIAYYLKKQQ
jgi:hypothetical protein